jgi:hypothetical protein
MGAWGHRIIAPAEGGDRPPSLIPDTDFHCALSGECPLGLEENGVWEGAEDGVPEIIGV